MYLPTTAAVSDHVRCVGIQKDPQEKIYTPSMYYLKYYSGPTPVGEFYYTYVVINKCGFVYVFCNRAVGSVRVSSKRWP